MNEDIVKTCAFSGHRILPRDFDFLLMDRVIRNLLLMGCRRFLCGMAQGFDLYAAESVLANRKEYPVQLVACIPCGTQSENFSEHSLIRYRKILEECDEKIIFSQDYYAGCMQQRNRYLVDNCDVLLTFLRRKSGGTYYTVNYAKRQGKKLIEL